MTPFATWLANIGLGGYESVFASNNIDFDVIRSLSEADLREIGVTTARAATIRGVAQALLDGRVDFRAEQTLESFVERWIALPGIGEWTAHYIAMRALSEPDAFPAADLILRREAAMDDVPLTTKALNARAESWRPWRAYAVMHLWRGASDNVAMLKQTSAKPTSDKPTRAKR